MAKLKVGSYTIETIYETDASSVIASVLEQATPKAVNGIEWLKPHYADDLGNIKSVNQSFLLRTKKDAIVLDTCVGNGRHLSDLPDWANLRTNFIGNLRKRVDPEDVRYVFNTHLHFDHIGWNTHKDTDSDTYIPTFPNAQYVFAEEELAYWRGRPEKELTDDTENIAVAVQPILDANLYRVVDATAKITEGVSLVPAPGHTPHHSCVLIESDGQSALYVGDLFHHPIQIAHPNWMSFDTDEEQAYTTRMRILEEYADTNTIIIAAHFAEPAWGKIVSKDGQYEWAPVEA